MFKRLGIFAVLAVCLFAIVIVMVGCGGDDDPPPPPPPPPMEEEKTFKEQLTEGSWRMVANADGTSVNAAAQVVADELSQEVGFPLKGTMAQNSLRFEDSGKATLSWGVSIFPPDDPADSFEMSMTLKGPYFVNEESDISATMSLSFTEVAAFNLKFGGEEADLAEAAGGEEALAEEAGLFGDFFTNERASINGDQLRIGQMLLER